MEKYNKRLIAIMIASLTALGSIVSTISAVDKIRDYDLLNREVQKKQDLLYSQIEKTPSFANAQTNTSNTRHDTIQQMIEEDPFIQTNYKDEIKYINSLKKDMSQVQKSGLISVAGLALSTSALAISIAQYTRNREDDLNDEEEIHQARR